MKAELAVAFVGLAMMAISDSWAGDMVEASGGTAPGAAAAAAVIESADQSLTIEPWIHSSMPNRVRAKLEAGFELAVQRVREVEACGDLFTALGADGLEVLASGLYLPVDSYLREVDVCGRNSAAISRGGDVLAYTKVGSAPTWICRHFARVSTETAAIAVIHEALHHAGLPEWPLDRTAMSSVEITKLVTDACGF
jgi:hypothetical protein